MTGGVIVKDDGAMQIADPQKPACLANEADGRARNDACKWYATTIFLASYRVPCNLTLFPAAWGERGEIFLSLSRAMDMIRVRSIVRRILQRTYYAM